MMMTPGGSGWNDPPKLSHEVHSETKSRKNLLNKRVAYLGHSPQKDNNQVLLPSLPPPTDAIVVNEIEASRLKDNPPPLNIFNPNAVLSDHLNGKDKNEPELGKNLKLSQDHDESPELLDIVTELRLLVQHCSNNENKMAVTDIEKKIEVLQEMLRNKSISTPVQSGMNQLTSHLLKQQYDKAWKMHVSLMCDHVSEVRSWMVGIKRLINELKKLSLSEQ